MEARRLYFVLTGVLCASLIVFLGAVYGANVLLQGQAKRLNDAKLQSLVLDEKQDRLTKARADVEKYKSLAAIAKHIVPQDKDQAQTVREIVSLANANGIKLGAITFPSSTLGGTGTAASKSKEALSQLKPVKNISGVYSLEITVQSDTTSPASYDRFISFLDALEHNRRTALVSSISLQPDANNASNLTFTLNLSEYIKP
ncbi:MAG TPA: hypothetical protein VJ836_07870 [Candidatus Saccharimonadales bacterium]|nr:hypothetical protein [Candidatus Saccharimonadales bacterium]